MRRIVWDDQAADYSEAEHDLVRELLARGCWQEVAVIHALKAELGAHLEEPPAPAPEQLALVA